MGRSSEAPSSRTTLASGNGRAAANREPHRRLAYALSQNKMEGFAQNPLRCLPKYGLLSESMNAVGLAYTVLQQTGREWQTP